MLNFLLMIHDYFWFFTVFQVNTCAKDINDDSKNVLMENGLQS